MKSRINIIGGGLAGSEAASLLCRLGYEVYLYERRPLVEDGAHEGDGLGELVCSNSLKGMKLDNASGLMKAEMGELGSLMVDAADHSKVPGGNALCVDRHAFSAYITDKLASYPNFHLVREEVRKLPEGPTILAVGPLFNGPLVEEMEKLTGSGGYHFYDASCPIVKKDSLDMSIVYEKSRYDKGDGGYLNAPFYSREDYFKFVRELLSAKRALLHDFDTVYFEGCMPIEAMAERGEETLRHGPLKPFGLFNGDLRPYAVVQLRQEDLLGDCYNLVGFQTNLTYGEQKRVFSMIPGLENAEFVRYGLMHRNFYFDSPKVLNEDFSFRGREDLFAAGQITGVEGYVESALSGLVSAYYLHRKLSGLPFDPVPRETMSGALLHYVTHYTGKRLEPMNANWALMDGVGKKDREAYAERSIGIIRAYGQPISRP